MTETFEATAPKVPHAGSRSGRVSSLLCSRSTESDAIERPSGEIAVGKNRPELRRAGSGANLAG
jgi:hypothetical protein